MPESVWDDVRGHETPIELLRRSASRGRIAHGYAFFGAHGTGRQLVARKLAQSLFCPNVPDDQLDACGTCPSCKQMLAANHPDLLAVAKPSGKRELPIDLIAGRSEKRGREGLCYELAMRPMSAPRRIAIVNDAETMNAESANALLKTLEEPPPGGVLILIATSPDAILPTIRSRVQPLHFGRLSDEDIAALLGQHHQIDPQTTSQIAPLANGSLATAEELLDDDLRAFRQTAVSAVATVPFNAVRAAASLTKAIDDLGGDASATRQQADWAFRFIVDFYRAALTTVTLGHGSEQSQRFADSLPADDDLRVERIGRAIERVIAAEAAVAQMTAVPLAIEGLCDDLSAILRGADRPILEQPA